MSAGLNNKHPSFYNDKLLFNFSDSSLQKLLSGQQELCVLELKKLPKLSIKGLSAIKSPALWKVVIKQCLSVNAEGKLLNF